MNCILLQTADYSQALDIVTDDLPAIDDAFATTPMRSIPPAFYAHHEEEEIYTSFEEAISDRVLAMQRQTQQLSPRSSAIPRRKIMNNARHRPIISTSFNSPRLERGWQRIMLRGSLGMALVLSGFDLMGLLVLHLH